MARLTDYRVLTFDCYGTLIDWEAGIWDALQPLIMGGGDSAVTREAALLAFAKWEAHHEHASPGLRYPELLVRVHRSMAESLDLETNDALDEAFGASTPLGRRSLIQRTRCASSSGVISSSSSRTSTARASPPRTASWGVAFDAVYTAEDIGSYKPADANFEYLLSHLKSDFDLERSTSCTPRRACGTTTLPANRFGLANAWIDRQRLSEGGSWGATEKVEGDPDNRFHILFDGRDGRSGRGGCGLGDARRERALPARDSRG